MPRLDPKRITEEDLDWPFQLADPEVDLDLTSDVWNLSDRQASVIVGRDVVRPGIWAPDGGRQPAGVSIASGDRPLTDAWGLEFFGRTAVRYRDHYETTGSINYLGTTTSLKKVTTPFAWPSEMVGGFISVNEDERTGSGTAARRRITSISTTTETDDTLNWSDSAGVLSWTAQDKFNIVYPKFYDKRGIVATNGRKFWILHAGTWSQFLDLGSGLEGQRWDAAIIAPNLVMFVNPAYPPRIIRLSDAASTDASTNLSLGGLITPIKPFDPEIPGVTTNFSWKMKRASGGSMTASANGIRSLVRAVDLEHRAVSRFVTVHEEDSNPPDDRLAITADDRVAVWVEDGINDAGEDPPPLHERWSHIEVWRTPADGVNYFLETRIEIADQLNEDAGGATTNLNVIASEQYYPIEDSDTTIHQYPQATLSDLVSGGPPPICRKVTSLNGITICGGRSDATVNEPTAYARFFRSLAYRHQVVTSKSELDLAPSGNLANYTFKSGDQFVVTSGGTAGLTAGAYAIESQPDDDTIRLTANIGAADAAYDVEGYIQRPYTIDWPKIESDEELWYSRTDQFEPENFPARILRLSSIGDTLRDIVKVGNYVAVVMDQGVHLVYLVNGALTHDTIAHSGQGSPWEHSVVVVSNSVLWASADGPKVMRVSNEPNSLGVRATVEFLGGNSMRQWFRDAYDNDYAIDAGVDVLNHCVRWRRKEGDNAWQVAQYSYLTGKWTLLDDDNGLAYAATAYAESTESDQPILYSVEKTGNVFRVNHGGLTHTYDSVTVQAATDATYAVTTTTITKTAAFSTAMLGDIVRFRSDTSTVNGAARVITAATANAITFDAVTGLAAGDEFIIAANRFKYRPAPLAGGKRSSVKNLDALHLRALPGPRNTSGNWTDPPAGKFSVRAYGDYGSTAQDDNDQEIAVYDEDDTSHITSDRESAVEAVASAIEVEIEMIESRTDFRIESLEAVVREERSQTVDASTES